MALEALTRIGELYHIEQQGKEFSIEARLKLRVEHSQPKLHVLQQWLIQTRVKTISEIIDFLLPLIMKYHLLQSSLDNIRLN